VLSCVDEVATAKGRGPRVRLVRAMEAWIRPGGSEACLSSRRPGSQEAKPGSLQVFIFAIIGGRS
jgi:hypothetical protein